MGTEQFTRYEVRDGAAWITLASNETRNAMTEPLIQELLAHLRGATEAEAVRSIVLTGEGAAFCAGADLKNQGRMGGSARAGGNPLVDILRLMRHGPKPVVCAINGHAFGGGLGLVAAGDIAIAVEDAKFSFSEVRLGLIPAMISVVVLPKLGEHLMTRLFLTGERFDARRALEYGLLHQVVPRDGLVAAVEAELDLLAQAGPVALAEAKRLVRTVARLPEDEAFGYAEQKIAELFASDEAAEGMAAFREKRPPRWAKPRSR